VSDAIDRLFDEVWNRGRLAVLDEIVSADVLVHAGADEARGREALRAVVADWLVAFPDIHHVVDDRFPRADGAVAVRWHGTGTHRGPFLDIAPTGRPIAYWGVTIARTDAAGVMTELWATATTAELIAGLRA
jgi:predicted ester cyclase